MDLESVYSSCKILSELCVLPSSYFSDLNAWGTSRATWKQFLYRCQASCIEPAISPMPKPNDIFIDVGADMIDKK